MEEIGDDEIVAAFERVESARRGVALTYFEYAILAAFRVFRDRDVDAAVLEVGLGGRLDAVNIVDADVAVITSIGLDHQDYLGAGLEAIGAEKAGVMRPGRPVIFGARDVPDSVCQRAAELKAPLTRNGVDYRLVDDARGWSIDLCSGRRLRVGERPKVAADNAAAALQAFAMIEPDFDSAAVAEACRQACSGAMKASSLRPAGSWDVAHTPMRRRVPAEGLMRAYARFSDCSRQDHAGVVGRLSDCRGQVGCEPTPASGD